MEPTQDGPNTHKYLTADHITNWTVIPLYDPVTAIRHFFHVPTVLVEEIERQVRAASRPVGEEGLRAAASAVLEALQPTPLGLGMWRTPTVRYDSPAIEVLRRALAVKPTPEPEGLDVERLAAAH